VFGLYESSGISPQHADYGKKMYLKNMGYEHPYYSFDHQGWHFIILDGIGFTAERKYYGYVDSTQLAWLEKDLRAVAPQTPIVVTTHIPLTSVYGQFAKGATYGMSQSEVIVNARDVLQRFDNHNLKLVLQGHLHAVEHIRFRDRHFITGGAVSGEWWKGPRDGFPEGFVIINAQTNDFDWRYESFGWDAKKHVENE
jgi:3',5'-cyclic AMP phosphodiesterase CpdA